MEKNVEKRIKIFNGREKDKENKEAYFNKFIIKFITKNKFL